MEKKKELERTSKLVKKILIENPKARGCDPYLYVKVMEKLNPEAKNKRFAEVMLNLKELGLPCFETVRRTRADIRSKNPDLKPDKEIQDFRTELEEEFRDYFS